MIADQGLVDEAAEVARDQAERRPEHGAEQRREQGDDDDAPGAGDHAREDVAAELVGAEPVRAATGAARMSLRGPEVVVRREPLAEDRADDPEENDQRADDERRRAQQRAAASRGVRP